MRWSWLVYVFVLVDNFLNWYFSFFPFLFYHLILMHLSPFLILVHVEGKLDFKHVVNRKSTEF